MAEALNTCEGRKGREGKRGQYTSCAVGGGGGGIILDKSIAVEDLLG